MSQETMPVRRLPIVATLLVAISVAIMIGLGLWQLLVRLPEKEVQLAQLTANPSLPVIRFPMAPDDRQLFRRTAANCVDVMGITRAGAGAAGYRLIADCRVAPDAGNLAGGEGVIKVQLGTTRDPLKEVRWTGGLVTGWVSHAPDATPLGARILSPAPRQLLLVADRPAEGLTANTRPDIGLVPNNHLAYAGQWFFFALIAAVIYALAIRRRGQVRSGPRAR